MISPKIRRGCTSGSAKTFVVANDYHVIGYCSLTVGLIDTLEVPERFRRGMGHYPIPVFILARLAVPIDYQAWVLV